MRDLFIKDWGWKLLSVILAADIWWTVHKIVDPTNTDAAAVGNTFTYDNLPVTVVSATADVHEFRVNPAAVKVTVRGPAGVMKNFKIGDVHAVVEFAETNLTRNVELPVEIVAPANVTITSVDPPRALVIAPPAPEKKP